MYYFIPKSQIMFVFHNLSGLIVKLQLTYLYQNDFFPRYCVL